MTVNLLGAARWYRRLGLTVIELPYGYKWRDGWKEYQSRQPTDHELEDWFSDGRHNIGIVNGKVSGNACSIDVDDALLFESMLDGSGAQRGLVRSLVTTGSRGGHIWLRSRAPVATNLDIADAVELRGEGSITVVPPSVHPSGCRYRMRGYAAGILMVDDAEAWLRDLLVRLGIKPRDTDHRKAISPLQLLAEPIYETSPGRNKTLTRIGGYLHNRLPPDWTSALLHAINDARCEPPLDPEEVEGIIRSMCRYPQRHMKPLETRERDLIREVLE